MSTEGGLIALFLSGFISATLLPGGSEALLAWQLTETRHDPWVLWLTVSAGNTLGGVVTFIMGGWLARYRPLKALDNPQQSRAKGWIERYGAFSLLLSWLPFIGDPLCLVAGWLKTHFWLSLFMIALGKSIRYLLIVGLV